ncbi:MAG: DUF998 domain-containing protein [Acidimicrobiia bacterium]
MSDISSFDRGRPPGITGRRAEAGLVLFLLFASVVSVLIAPLLMPSSYSIVEHSISESAAQGVEGAWLARLGFLMFGLAVLLLASIAGDRWGIWGRIAHRVWGVSMIAAAVFSHMPWLDTPYDVFEDTLHSIASFAVGMSFIVGVLLVTFRRGPGTSLVRVFDWIALGVALVVPPVMFNFAGVAGVVQRVMFAIAYLWYGSEALRLARDGPSVGAKSRSLHAASSIEPGHE